MLSRYSVLLTAIALAALVAGVATATPPSNIVGTFLARGTTSESFSFDVPREVEVTKKVRLKTRKGQKPRFRIVKVKQTVLKPLIACGPASQCDAVVQTIAFQPGGSTGWHSHPGALVVTVKSGTVTRYEASCQKNAYSAGQAFVEMGPEHLVLVRNEGTEPAEVYVTYLVPAGTANAALRVDQAAPSVCASVG